MNIRKEIKPYAEAPISRQLVLEVLKAYKRPNDKISELLKDKSLIALKKGLYTVGPNLDLPTPSTFLIANHLRGPSYISLESALAYWDMIPERVYEISSMTLKTSKRYSTEVGRFSYHQLKTPYYSFGLKSITYSPKQRFLIASKEKALCDKIISTANINLRSVLQTQEFLFKDLRIDEDSLKTLDIGKIDSWIIDAPKKTSLKMLIKTLQGL